MKIATALFPDRIQENAQRIDSVNCGWPERFTPPIGALLSTRACRTR